MVFNVNSLLLELVALSLDDISLFQDESLEIGCQITQKLLHNAFGFVDVGVK